MSDDQMLKCLIAFVLGWIVSRHMGNGFSVGAVEQADEEVCKDKDKESCDSDKCVWDLGSCSIRNMPYCTGNEVTNKTNCNQLIFNNKDFMDKDDKNIYYNPYNENEAIHYHNGYFPWHEYVDKLLGKGHYVTVDGKSFQCDGNLYGHSYFTDPRNTTTLQTGNQCQKDNRTLLYHDWNKEKYYPYCKGRMIGSIFGDGGDCWKGALSYKIKNIKNLARSLETNPDIADSQDEMAEYIKKTYGGLWYMERDGKLWQCDGKDYEDPRNQNNPIKLKPNVNPCKNPPTAYHS